MSANPWINHIFETQHANPGMSYGEAMGEAKLTYNKQRGGTKSAKSKSSKSRKPKAVYAPYATCKKITHKPYSLSSRSVPPYRARNCKSKKMGMSRSRKNPRSKTEYVPYKNPSGRWIWKAVPWSAYFKPPPWGGLFFKKGAKLKNSTGTPTVPSSAYFKSKMPHLWCVIVTSDVNLRKATFKERCS